MFRRFNKNHFSSLKQIYEKQVKEANKTEDPVQLIAINHLQKLHDDLVKTHESWKKNI